MQDTKTVVVIEKPMYRLTKYQETKLVGTRALQITQGAPIMIDPGNETDAGIIAQMEFDQNKLPYALLQSYTNGTYNVIQPSQFIHRPTS